MLKAEGDMVELTVGKGGDYSSIQEALDAIPYRIPARVVVKKGEYHEKLFCDKHDLTLVGEDGAVVSWDDGAWETVSDGYKRGTFRSSTAFFSGERLRLVNLTIRNTAGKGSEVGQAVALYLDVRHARLEKMALEGWQDTLFLAPLPQKEREPRGFFGPRVFAPRLKSEVVVVDSVITGDIDFIFGGADALFSHCDIISRGPGYVAAPSGNRRDRGFVFADCRFLSDGAPDGSVYLMRPWRPEGKVTCIRCTYGAQIHPDGFHGWQGREAEKRFGFAEYHCSGVQPMRRLPPARELTEAEASTLVTSFGMP
ncbi:MAG: pectinesterase family protein [Sphaerochaeta sp.]|jgi:pectinesterase|nr:pectinesterase family protein [Sphaerochaeta sp.]MCI2128840.1 pectinesterase family protein [Sphaerochaeta sp.]